MTGSSQKSPNVEEHGQRREEVESGEIEALLPSTTPQHEHESWQSKNIRIYVILFVMLASVNLSLQIMVPAQTRIFESIFCRQWYRDHDDLANILLPNGSIEERLCKIPAVQKDVSTLRGWMEWWDALPGLFLAIPFGIIADQVGRKWLLRLSVSVILLREVWITFVSAVGIPLRAVYLGSAFNIVCGGNMIAEMLFCVVVTDITPRQKLPIIFFQLNALGQFTKVLGPAVSGGLMHLSPWYPVLCGIALLLLGSVLSFTVPETLKKVDKHHTEPDSPRPRRTGLRSRVKGAWATYLKSLRDLAAIWTDWRLTFLALLYPFRMMTMTLDDLIQRYVSLRYGWTLGNATFLYSLQACVAGVILLIALPWISTAIEEKLHLSAINKNVVIARYSLALLAVGFLIEGLAPTVQVLILGLTVQSLGSGAPPALRALAGVLVEKEDNGRVFSGLAISETLSIMAAYPLSAALFNAGISMGGGVWLGLPFYTTALAVAVVTFIMFFLRFEGEREHEDSESSNALDDLRM